MELLEVIKTLPCMVMISGYESDLYKEMLKGWHIHTFQAKTSIGVATEWLWMNYPPPSQLHEKIEFEYKRNGTLCLIPSFDVAKGEIIQYSIGETRNEFDFVEHIKKTIRWDSGKKTVKKIKLQLIGKS